MFSDHELGLTKVSLEETHLQCMNSMPSKSIKTFFFSGNQIGATIQGGQHLEG